jgi:hypothetical protein
LDLLTHYFYATSNQHKEMSYRRQQAQNTTMALRAIGTLLFVAMAVGLIVSSVLWSNEVAALKRANNFTVTTSTVILGSVDDARVISVSNVYFQDATRYLRTITTVTEFPTYFQITYFVGGSFNYNDSASGSSIVVSGMLSDAFPFPSVGAIDSPAGVLSCIVPIGGSALAVAFFTTNSATGLITDLNIQVPLPYLSPPAPANDGAAVIASYPITWVVYK